MTLSSADYTDFRGITARLKPRATLLLFFKG